MDTLPLTAGELTALRDDSEELLPDTCRIYRETPSELRPGDTWTSDSDSTIYQGACSLKVIPTKRDRYDNFGEGLVYSHQYRLILPYTATGIRITDKVQMLTSDDPDVLTRTFEVRDIHRSSQISQRRVTLHDIGR